MRSLLLCWCVLVVSWNSVLSKASGKSIVIRIHVDSAWLRDHSLFISPFLYNILTDTRRPNLLKQNWTEIVISDTERRKIASILDRLKLNWSVVELDLKRLLASQPLEKSERQKRQENDDEGRLPFSMNYYHSLESMERYFRFLAWHYPKFVKLMNIGTTYENRSLFVLKLGNDVRFENVTKPAIWVNGGLHAREWASPHSVIYYIRKLLTDHLEGNNPDRLNKLIWYIAPMLNPDGYAFTFRNADHTWLRLRRKNRSGLRCRPKGFRSTSSLDRRRCCVGVDLNRNFDFSWTGRFSDHATRADYNDPCSQTYHGPHAFSEEETKAVRDFVESDERLGKLKAAVDIHCFAQVWLHPFGHRKNAYPADIRDVKSLALRAVARMKKVHGAEYAVGAGPDQWCQLVCERERNQKESVGYLSVSPSVRYSNRYSLDIVGPILQRRYN